LPEFITLKAGADRRMDMLNDFEKIIRTIYREGKVKAPFIGQDHPSEENLACFIENKLPAKDRNIIRKHLLRCETCAECLSVQLKIHPHLSLDVPAPLLEKVKEMVSLQAGENLLEIFLRLKEQALEIIQTTGDVLFGQELVPAPVLRSRKINEFKEELSILKDFQQIRVLAKIQNKSIKNFNLTITVKDKQNQKNDLDLRVTLLKDGLELESYINDSGSSFFENISPGNYSVEISRQGQLEAVIDLKVKA
jgi:hypothetical protein